MVWGWGRVTGDVHKLLACTDRPEARILGKKDGSYVAGRAGRTRTFVTGATRDTDNGKLDYEGFISPLALRRYAQYLHKHRVQSDGKLRDSDNWQKGIPREVYMKSAWRHFMAWWLAHRGGGNPEEALCALLFNAQGYLHEILRVKRKGN